MDYLLTGEQKISIHALREEGDVIQDGFAVLVARFLSTPSARRATTTITSSYTQDGDFYPRPPRGGRPSVRSASHRRFYFYPRPPRGGRHFRSGHGLIAVIISIHALREEGDVIRVGNLLVGNISIHALREEGDGRFWAKKVPRHHFYPRPPRGGRPERITITIKPNNFYPRPPRGGRPISGHSQQHQKRFLSTPSARRATGQASVPFRPSRYFYPRPPRGGRQFRIRSCFSPYLFLSTPSARRATS